MKYIIRNLVCVNRSWRAKNYLIFYISLYFSLIIAYCEANEEICKQLGINLSSEGGNTNTLLGEDDISILEAMLLFLGVIVGVGGFLGILLLCCLRRRFVVQFFLPSVASKLLRLSGSRGHYF